MNTARNSDRFIGLMSGTSMDGVDAALVEFRGQDFEVLHTLQCPYENALHQELNAVINDPDSAGLGTYGDLHIRVARQFAFTTRRLLKTAGISTDSISAIGSHGQTVLHSPGSTHPFSLQLGDPGTLAALTGIKVVADFRNSDIALGGQGAPLTPAFHRWMAGDDGIDRVVINIGGIANITVLPARGEIRGFDTGPGNTLLDAWCQEHLNRPFDDQGVWAEGGTVNQQLLAQMRGDPYFAQQGPKSTGTDYFNLQWIHHQLDAAQQATGAGRDQTELQAQDVQATLSELTAAEIARGITTAIQAVPGLSEARICGGGAKNSDLITRLRRLTPGCAFDTTDSWGIPPDWVEAVGFAWMARERLCGHPTNVPGVTGASGSISLGGLYLPAVSPNDSDP